MSLRAIIVDDELNGITALKTLIEKYTPEVKVVATSTSATEALEIIADYSPDLLFLDISMPKMNGFELLENIENKSFKVIFTTAHAEFAIKALRSRAHDYLLKPIDVEELKTCVNSLKLSMGNSVTAEKKNSKSLLELHVRGGIIFIRQTDIIRLEAEGSYTNFILENGVRHMASKNLKECESMLDAQLFFRTHPSHIINISKIDRLLSNDGLSVKMTDGSSAVLLRKNKEQLLEMLKNI